MSASHIHTVEELQFYLWKAMQLEHATIPPYLTALYSIHPQTNADARHILRVVVVEEMLHLTLAANLLNAIGGDPDLTKPGFVPRYATALPDGETDFQVGIEKFSPAALATFLKIERPRMAPNEAARHMPSRHKHTPHVHRLGAVPQDPELDFYSIGEFYTEIRRGFKSLHATHGDSLFGGDIKRQVTPEYYYSGGGEMHVVKCIHSANKAIDLIIGQGEGKGDLFDAEGEVSHFARFTQLDLRRYYTKSDQPGHPTGPAIDIDWNAVYPVKSNARLADYADDPQLWAAAKAFNDDYAAFLALLTSAFKGNPQTLMPAVTKMFKLRDKFNQLVRHPLPGDTGENASPTFEIGAA